jgi:cell wall-associated NlpC family hydrolase
MADPNIGASRLLGTNGLQQAVDSLETKINRLANDFSKLSSSIGNLTGNTNRTTGGSRTGNNWNSSSNRSNYSSNGGGGTFSSYATFGAGGRGNGGGGVFSPRTSSGMSPNSGSKFAAASGAAFSVAAGLTAYGNQNMSSNMQMNMFGAQTAVAGGGGAAGMNLAQRQAFGNNNIALNANDATRAAYTNSFVFGNPQFNGQANPAFTSGMRQVQGFAYASPTMGAAAAANAAQQTYSARSLLMSQALGLRPTIGMGGTKTSMGDIAQSIYQQTFGNKNISIPQFNAATTQGGSLAVNLQYMGQQMGWDQSTTTMYQNYLQGMVAAQNNGMSRKDYDTLSQAAANNDKGAIAKLTKTTGLGASMFENQRSLNATRLTRQEDILESLAPAFNDATKSVQNFSNALTTFLKQTHLDQAIGAGAGFGSAISGGLGGFSNAFGAAGGVMTAARLFGLGGGASGGLGGLFSKVGGLFGGGGAAGGLGSQGANGVYNITTLGAGGTSTLAKAGRILGPVGEALLSKSILDKGLGNKNTLTNQLNDPNSFLGKKIIPRTTTTDGKNGGGTNSNSAGGSSPANGATNGTGATASQIIHFAETQLGVPYVWGGTTPGKGLDCSGLTQWAFGQAGVKIPRVADAQQSASTRVPLTNLQPGDLLFKGEPAHHVALNIGNGQLIEAPHSGLNVRIRSFNPSEFTNAGRVVGAVGNTSSLLNNNSSGNTNTLNNQQARTGGDIGNIGAGYSERSTILSALSGSLASLPASSGSKSTGATSGTDQLGTTPTGNGGNDKASLQAYAKQLLSKYGWGSQWSSFDALVMSESGWDYKATNPSSGAYGIPQSLPPSKLSSAGSDWQTSGDTQLRWMMDYVKSRYGSPDNAWSFHQKNNWYASGAWSIDQDQAAQVHKGEMILPAKQAETVRSAITNAITNKSGIGTGGGFSVGTIQVNLPTGYTGTKQEAQMTGKMIVDAIMENSRTQMLKRGQ